MTSGGTDVDVRKLIVRLKRAYPEAECALRHGDPFQLLVATILSAQCTDARVNMVTPRLFARYPDPETMKDAGPGEIEDLIRSTGFYRNKTKSILGASRRIVEAYGGKVPATMEELLTLPGVARKTANVVLGVGFGVGVGVVVDTHVDRIAHRLGLTKGRNPEQVERDLMAALPRAEWIQFPHLLIHHGRRICIARKPKCGECPVQDLCPAASHFLSGRKPPHEKAKAKRGAAAGAAKRASSRTIL